MAKSAKSQFAVLGMLAILKKCSGYDLKKHMEASTQYFWKETFSSIYPILEDLEKQELIVKIDVRAKNDRKRNVYSLTPQGTNVLTAWLLKNPDDIQVKNELLLKLFFGEFVPTKVSIEHLENYKKELTNKLSSFREIETKLRNASSSESLYSLIALDHGISQVSTSLEWCERAITTLKSNKQKTNVGVL